MAAERRELGGLEGLGGQCGRRSFVPLLAAEAQKHLDRETVSRTGALRPDVVLQLL